MARKQREHKTDEGRFCKHGIDVSLKSETLREDGESVVRYYGNICAKCVEETSIAMYPTNRTRIEEGRG